MLSAAPLPVSPDGRPLRDILGVCHINGFYHFGDGDYLNEGADRVLELGSRVIKLVLGQNQSGCYPFNMQWSEHPGLVELAETKYFQDVFNKPFTACVLMSLAPGRPLL